MKRIVGVCILLGVLLSACASVDLEAPIPVYETGVAGEAWVTIPAGDFLSGQFNDPTLMEYDSEMNSMLPSMKSRSLQETTSSSLSTILLPGFTTMAIISMLRLVMKTIP